MNKNVDWHKKNNKIAIIVRKSYMNITNGNIGI